MDEIISIACGNFIINDYERLESYSHDEVADTTFHHYPEIVIKPRSAELVLRIMKLVNRENIPVTLRGAGSGLTYGAVPL